MVTVPARMSSGRTSFFARCVLGSLIVTAAFLPSGVAIATGPLVPLLRTASSYLVLGQAGVTSTGGTVVSGDVGVGPGFSMVGFPPGEVGGEIHVADTAAGQALTDASLAYNDLSTRTPDRSFAGDQNGATFTTGVYATPAAFALTGSMTLDALGDPSAVFVFQIDAAMNLAAGARVVLVNGALASNVYWKVTGAAGMGASSVLSGTILAAGAITVGEGAKVVGRAFSQAAVTLANNGFTFTDVLAPTLTIVGGAHSFSPGNLPSVSGSISTAFIAPTTVTLTIAGQTLHAQVAAGNGVWTIVTTYIPDGTYSARASVADSDGNKASAGQILTVGANAGLIALRSASTYSVFGGDGVTSTGVAVLSDDLGSSPSASIVGFPPGVVGGVIHGGDLNAAQARTDLDLAYSDAQGRTSTGVFAGDQNGAVFRAGVYYTAGAFALTGNMTLDAENNPNAVFVFQIDAALNTAAASHILLANGALASHVFWQANGAVGTGANSTFVGTILGSAAITLGAGSSLDGRALGDGLVTLASNMVTNPPADPPPPPSGFLSITVPSQLVVLGSVTDSVDGELVSGPLGRVTVTDTRENPIGFGWVASVSSTSFLPSVPGPAIRASAVSYVAGTIGYTGTGMAIASDPTGLNSSAPAVTYTGATGQSAAAWNPLLEVRIPAGATVATYTATITHSVA